MNQDTMVDRYTEEAVKFIAANKDKPFFLYFAHNMPHRPLHVADRFRGKSAGGLYGDAVESIDWSIGQVLDALKANGVDEQHARRLHDRQRPVALDRRAGRLRVPAPRRQGHHLRGRHARPVHRALAGQGPRRRRLPRAALPPRPDADDRRPRRRQAAGGRKIDGKDISPDPARPSPTRRTPTRRCSTTPTATSTPSAPAAGSSGLRRRSRTRPSTASTSSPTRRSRRRSTTSSATPPSRRTSPTITRTSSSGSRRSAMTPGGSWATTIAASPEPARHRSAGSRNARRSVTADHRAGRAIIHRRRSGNAGVALHQFRLMTYQRPSRAGRGVAEASVATIAPPLVSMVRGKSPVVVPAVKRSVSVPLPDA